MSAPAVLDLVWKPSANQPSPPAGKAPAIIRDDTFSHTFRVTAGVTNGYGAWSYIAQIRSARVTGSTAAAPLLAFTVALTLEAVDLLITLSLTAAQTLALALPSGGYWDMQLTSGATKVTWLSGKVVILNDVSRAA